MKKKVLLITIVLFSFFLFRVFSYPPNRKTNLYQEIISTRILCELSVGSKRFDDFFQTNRSLCYGGKASKGDFLACYQTHNPSECLVSASLNTKTFLCNKLDKQIQDKCYKQLFDYYSERALNFNNIDEIYNSEVITIKNEEKLNLITDKTVLNVNGKLMNENKRCISSGGNLNCTIESYTPFECTNNGMPLKLTGKGANHKLGEPILFINKCEALPNNDVEVEVWRFQ